MIEKLYNLGFYFGSLENDLVLKCCRDLDLKSVT